MDEKKKTLKFGKEKLFLQVTQYINNGNLAILAYTEEEPYGDITTNLSEHWVDEDEGFIDGLTKDSGLEEKLIEEGIIKEITSTVNYNMGKYDLAVFDMEKLKEYDPKGIEEYKKSLENEEELE
ncbi:MAG: DUF4313 domain-containing protein [Clostridia bacterium]|nr:DUF4313 domain-containing protein [Clostridia bacterium]